VVLFWSARCSEDFNAKTHIKEISHVVDLACGLISILVTVRGTLVRTMDNDPDALSVSCTPGW
jgi:hypothetical protein